LGLKGALCEAVSRGAVLLFHFSYQQQKLYVSGTKANSLVSVGEYQRGLKDELGRYDDLLMVNEKHGLVGRISLKASLILGWLLVAYFSRLIESF